MYHSHYIDAQAAQVVVPTAIALKGSISRPALHLHAEGRRHR